MDITQVSDGRIELLLSLDELRIIRGGLRETLDALGSVDIPGRMGVDEKNVIDLLYALLGRPSPVQVEMTQSDNIVILRVAEGQFRTLQRGLAVALEELEEWEFPIRFGHEVVDAQLLRDELRNHAERMLAPPPEG